MTELTEDTTISAHRTVASPRAQLIERICSQLANRTELYPALVERLVGDEIDVLVSAAIRSAHHGCDSCASAQMAR